MPRLPQPGSDQGTWGDILNDFLKAAHNDDGSLKPIAQNQVVGLSGVLSSKADLANVDNLQSDIASIQSELDAKVGTNDPRLGDPRTPLDASVTNTKVASNAAISADKLTDGTNNKLMTAAERDSLSGATYLNSANTLVRRTGGGSAAFANVDVMNIPTTTTHATRKDYVDQYGSRALQVNIAAATGTITLTADSLPSVRTYTLSGNVTLDALPSSGLPTNLAGVVEVTFKQAATGGPYTVAWPSVVWAGGAGAPVMPAAANAELTVALRWANNVWRATLVGVFYP